MMFHKSIHASKMMFVGILMVMVLGLCTWTYPVSSADSSMTNADATNGTKIVAVEDVLKSPENFSGTMGVAGRVMNIDQSKSMFFLGCKTSTPCACAMMPVKYGGQMPEIGSDIVVIGKITTTEAGKFIFEGQEVKPE